MPREVDFGPLTIHFYGLVIAIAIFIGWFLARKRAYLYKIPQKIFDDPILIIPLVLAIIGARFYHVLDYWDYYSNNPNQIHAIWNGGLGIWGALVGIFIGFFIVVKLKKLNVLDVLDVASPSILLGQALGRFANFINQEGFGPPTEKPWGIFIDQLHRPAEFINSTHFHPTFFYEAIINFIFFIILLIISQRLKRGQVFSLYLVFYASGRFIVEFWRIDTWIIGSVKVAQVLAILAFLLGIWLFVSFGKKREYASSGT